MTELAAAPMPNRFAQFYALTKPKVVQLIVFCALIGMVLAVPGMPVGSPGMDGPVYGGRHDPYDVLLVLKNGSSRVFQAYRG